MAELTKEQVITKTSELPTLEEKYSYLSSNIKIIESSIMYSFLGRLAEKLTKSDEARNYYEKSRKSYEKEIKLNPNNADNYNEFANLLQNNFKEYDLARVNYEKAIELNPNKAIFYNDFGSLLMNNYFKEFNLSREYFEKAIELNPEYILAFNNLAYLLQNDYFKEYEQARQYYEKSINIKPNEIAYNNLAALLQNDYFKEYELAREYYEKAIELTPNDVVSYKNLGILLSNNYFKEYDLAKEYHKKAIEINPDNDHAFYSFGVLLQNDYFKEYDLAKEYFEKTIKLNPNHANTYNNLALLLTKDSFKEYDLAREYYEKSIKLAPNSFKTYFNFGILFQDDYFKEYDLAQEYFEKTIELEPDYFGAYHNLANLYYYHFENKEKSNYYFAKAIELNKENILSRIALPQTMKKIPFVTEIDIKELRHLKNLNIKINKEKARHLLLTGSNGSGKTTILHECKNFLERLLDMPINELFTFKNKQELFEPDTYKLRLKINTDRLTDMRLAYESGVYVVKYLGANTGEDGDRSLNPMPQDSVVKVELPFVNKIKENLANKMVAYLVDLDYTRLRYHSENDHKNYDKIKAWFDNFLKILQSFDEHIVDMKYSRQENKNSFILKVKMPPNGEIVDVNFYELPDGYKAVFKIVFELILQMQSKVETTYNIPGIVFIDEPELFLHIKMQKKVMPALTSLFPNIQFIVATHSPFVLSSISNAVIFDLEKETRFEDASLLSYWGLAESYFDVNQYSNKAIELIEEYENLVNEKLEKKELPAVKFKRMMQLRTQFENLPSYFSKELSIKFSQIELKRIEQEND